MSQNTEKENTSDDNERVTIARLADKFLAEKKAETKEQAKAMARLEVAKSKAAKAKEKLKAIDEAKKKLEREQARKERFAKSQKERKERTKLLIETGGLVAKAGLIDWDAATLLGALVQAGKVDDSAKARFRAIGANLLNPPKDSPAVSPAPTPSETPPAHVAKQPVEQAPQIVPKIRVAVEFPAGASVQAERDLASAGFKLADVTNYRSRSIPSDGSIPSKPEMSWQGEITQNEQSKFEGFVKSNNGTLHYLD